MSDRGCVNCGMPRRGSAARCSACHVYRWRHGRERPEGVRIRAALRRLNAQLERQIVRRRELFEDSRSA